MFKPRALEAYEKEVERAKFAAISARRAAEAEKAANRESLRLWFQSFLDASHATGVEFEIVGERTVLTDDGALLFVRPEGYTYTKRGIQPDPFVLVYGLCPACKRLVNSNVHCRTLADVGRVLKDFPGDWTHTCGAVSEPMDLISWVLGLNPESKDKVFAAFYGMVPQDMERGFLFTRRGPVPLSDPDALSRVEDPRTGLGLTTDEWRALFVKAPGSAPEADLPPFAAGETLGSVSPARAFEEAAR